MDIRSLDGDDPATIALLLPGFQETMSLELPGDPPVSQALLARLLQRRHGADRIVLAAFDADRPAGCASSASTSVCRTDPATARCGSSCPVAAGAQVPPSSMPLVPNCAPEAGAA